jgi:hypothetical protein
VEEDQSACRIAVLSMIFLCYTGSNVHHSTAEVWQNERGNVFTLLRVHTGEDQNLCVRDVFRLFDIHDLAPDLQSSSVKFQLRQHAITQSYNNRASCTMLHGWSTSANIDLLGVQECKVFQPAMVRVVKDL